LGVKLAKVDVDSSPGLASKFFVTRLPTLFHIKNHQGKGNSTKFDTWNATEYDFLIPPSQYS
jgi:hypothetical protein